MNEGKQSSAASNTTAILVSIFWIISLIFTGYLAYAFGRESVQNQSKAEEKVLNAQTTQDQQLQPPPASVETAPTAATFDIPASTTTTTTSTNNQSVCGKTGLAQKWEYLKPYVVKANESMQSIATEQLKDASRVNELVKINGVGPFVVGSTLYLPPDSITKSSGNIQLVHGKLVDKNDTSWHVSFTGDKSGQGVLIPSFLFASVSNKDSFNVGDCLSVLFDNGYKIYSVVQQ